jgi:hypothetical protein
MSQVNKIDLKAKLRNKLNAKREQRAPKHKKGVNKEVAYRKSLPERDLIEIIANLQRDHFEEGLGIDECIMRYKWFFSNYKELFKICIDKRFNAEDYANLEYMLSINQQVVNGKVSYKDASSEVSRRGAERYQPELLKKPSRADKRADKRTKK